MSKQSIVFVVCLALGGNVCIGSPVCMAGLGLMLQATTVFVSPTGKTVGEGGDGSYGNPYDLETGLSQGAGGEVRFLPGTYLLGGCIALRDNTTYIGWGNTADAPAGLAGRDMVVIDGQGAVDCLSLNGGGNGTTMRDLTIRNARAAEASLAKFLQVSGSLMVTNCVFRDTTSGAGCVIATSCHPTQVGALSFVDCDFCGITATAASTADSSCGVMRSDDTFFLRCRIFGNTQNCNARSAIAYGSSDFTDCIISNNACISGGGFRMKTANFTHCTFADNNMKGAGLITTLGSNPKIVFNDCRFTNNINSASGACFGTDGASNDNGLLCLTNCSFVANETTAGNGGAICVDKNGWEVKIVGCGFTNNVAGSSANRAGQGGAVMLEATAKNSAALIKNCEFCGNRSQQWGGAVVGRWSQGITMDGCTFTTNVCSGKGGAFAQTTGTSGEIKNSHVLLNCTFEGNSALSRSAVYMTGVLTNCTFFDNNETDKDYYGALGLIAHDKNNTELYWTNRVAGCQFKGNRGRGIYSHGDTVFVTDTTIRETDGGAFDLCSASVFLIDRCYVVSNTTSAAGAAVLQTYKNSNNAKEGRIRNTIFVGNSNTGTYGGGNAPVVALADNTYVESCTFVENSAGTGLYGALQFSLPSGGVGPTDAARVVNTLFYRNKSLHGYERTDDSQFRADGVWTNVYFSCYSWIGGLPPDRNNINATAQAGNNDPMFVDFAGGDFNLAKGSPCVNVGSNETWMMDATDIRGNRRFARIQGGTVDIGCYELRPDPGLLLLIK